MFRLVPLPLCVVVLWAVFAPMGHGQTLDGFATLPYLASADPDAALDRIGATLDAMEQGEDADPRVIHDLYDLAADLLVEGGQAAQAAQIRARLAGFAVQYRDFLGIDPLPEFARAVALLRDTAQDEMARDTLLAMYDEQRAGGAGQGVLAETDRQIAQLSEALGEDAPDLTGPLSEGVFTENTIYYATTRAPSGEPDAARYFDDGRGDLSFGRASVTLPASPGPVDISKLRQVHPMDGRAWARDMTEAAPQSVLVYIPDAATGFEQAARRTALLTRALGGVDLPVLFSWPASASSLDYMADSAAAGAAARDLDRLLALLSDLPDRPRLHLLARGMGAQALAGALERIALRQGVDDPPRFDQVIFAVPDMDAERFTDLLPDLHPLAKRITLYASDRDWSMQLAQRLYGSALRAGWGGEATLTAPAVDSVDLSARAGDLLSDPGMLSDLAMLLWRDLPPDQRCGLTPEPAGAGDVPVWRYVEGICGNPALIGLLAAMRRADVHSREAALALLESTVSDPALRRRFRPVVSRLWPE
ncbi:alpha/beta hydrolase [Aquicoccus sp. SU-CL01552]|uniref:alpha/beta hydrolase n=1 Tax=Aquicoccus sp. SU-CL01552 TaxID=3127656 RepID=UPI003106F114